jgi:hypothetical protein
MVKVFAPLATTRDGILGHQFEEKTLLLHAIHRPVHSTLILKLCETRKLEFIHE